MRRFSLREILILLDSKPVVLIKKYRLFSQNVITDLDMKFSILLNNLM